MRFKAVKKIIYIFIGSFILYSSNSNAQSNPCNLTDPLGVNSGNLCPSHPSGLRSDSFHAGDGRPYRTLSTIQNPKGTIIVRPKGFWTEIKTSGSSRVIKESGGNSYQLSK